MAGGKRPSETLGQSGSTCAGARQFFVDGYGLFLWLDQSLYMSLCSFAIQSCSKKQKIHHGRRNIATAEIHHIAGILGKGYTRREAHLLKSKGELAAAAGQRAKRCPSMYTRFVYQVLPRPSMCSICAGKGYVSLSKGSQMKRPAVLIDFIKQSLQ